MCYLRLSAVLIALLASMVMIAGAETPLMGNQILIVNDGGNNTNPTNAFKTAMDNLGYTYDIVSSSSSTGIPATMLNYMAVLYAGVPSSGAEQSQLMAYLDAGGRLLIADNDFGYSDRSTVLYQTYFQATYVSDAGSDGVVEGVDIEAGTDVDISSDPYPDSFTIGPDAIGIFANTAPRINWAGMLIARLAYKAVYFAWDYHYAGGSAVGDAVETEIMGKVMPWLTSGETEGKVTGGIRQAFNKGRGGFNIQSSNGEVKGELQFQSDTIKFHASEMSQLIVASDQKSAWFTGIGDGDRPFTVYVEDNGEPGTNDIFRIWIAGELESDGYLTGGNIQIHK